MAKALQQLRVVHRARRVSCLSWKWRKRSSVKIAERTYEKGTKALHGRGEGGHSEAPPFWTRFRSRTCVRKWACGRRCSTAGRRSSSERSGCLSGSGASPPPGGGEAETDCVLGEEGADQGRGPGRVDGRARRAKKKSWGTLTGNWVPHDVRDQVMDFVRRWSEKTEIGVGRFVASLKER